MSDELGLVIRGVLSDGSKTDSTIRYAFGDLAQENQVTEKYQKPDGSPKVTAVLRPITNDVQHRLQKRHTQKRSTRNGVVEEFEKQAYTLDLFDYLIVEWDGILGEDHKPLVCTKQTKILLDADRLADMMRVASSHESPEVDAASFREPESVL